MANDLLISVVEDHMKDKKYNPQVSLVGYIVGTIDDKKHLVVSKKALKQGLKEMSHLSYYKLNIVINTYIEGGLLIDDGDNYGFNSVEAPFVGLQGETIRFCAKHLSIMDFKVYLYLMNKYQLNDGGKKNGRYVENYFFSKREIAKALGYNGTKESNILEINKSLMVLADIGLIEYSKSKRREGHQGYYHELYIAREYSSTHLKADAAYVKEKQEKGEEISDEILANIAAPIRKNIKVITATTDQRAALSAAKELLD